ncbi:hypothetical protein LIQ46_00235 [Megasphaera elsdenii]|uniref:hypothetical protein n=1 Tax=Megasphaera elsdenii TaxID=907 RepID=UPI001D01F326|nr:hypothetical protein [Megasphaera elsdenii]MCB5701425.1 hypothetical protein [Megasphaera elsdenii]MCB5726184.1 hypothetical protein [Megasphaera elsdenii]MCB5770093.1 hypothetical protein [Megasphaera elsdenii]
MYLPHLKEEVDKIVENKKTLIVFCIVLIFVFAFGWLLCRYYDICAREDGADVVRTVQSVKDDNQRARENIGTATEQIRQAGQQLDSLAESIDASSRTVDNNKAVIDDSRQLIESSQQNLEQAESILGDIDRANQLND